MDLQKYCPHKVVSAQEALAKIQKGHRVFLGTGCGEPQHLISTLIEETDVQDVVLYQMFSGTLSRYLDDEGFFRRFALKLFFISVAMRAAAFEGKIEYIPVYLSQLPELFTSYAIGLDVALIQVCPPDEFGYCSLGISVDVTKAALESAGLVIAQVNPVMPRTFGDSFVHLDDIDYLVWHEAPLLNYLPQIKDPGVARRIGHYVSQLVDDGATLQIGFGSLPYAILKYLENKQDLGLHTQLITDGFLPLFENKIITNKKKTHIRGRAVASMCMGTEKIYHYVHNNPRFYFRTSDYVSNPTVISLNDNLISISSALEVDLTGQVCSDSIGFMFYSGIGDQVDFLRGSAMSKGGYSIIALPSTADGGRVSRIVPHLSLGAGVATTRGDVNYVVTEYGIAELHGKGVYQRVMELAQIAHPDFRNELIETAKQRQYIFQDQLPPSFDDLLFLEDYKSTMTLKNGKNVSFRPLLPSDEFAYRNFFYSLERETIFRRFFFYQELFTHEVAQLEWSSIDYRKNMALIALARKGGHEEIIGVGSYAASDGSSAEVAFVVREDYQGLGIASYFLQELEKIATENGFKSFGASVLKENSKMIHVFKKKYPNAKVSLSAEDDYRIQMDFYDAIEHPGDWFG
jgi:acyl-CoA hydrolase/RimJ/RimL family protein N-acetyltransferase